MYFKKLTSLFLRFLTLGLKFSLGFIFVIYFNSSDFGLLTIFSTLALFFSVFCGFEFYTYSNRFLVGLDRNLWGQYLVQHFLFILLIFFIAAPFMGLIFYYDYLPWNVLLIFYLIAFFEIINQELMRVMLIADMQIEAAISNFIRNGSWIIVFFIFVFLSGDNFDLLKVAFMWGGAQIFCLFISIFSLKKKSVVLNIFNCKLNVTWMKNGISLGFLYFLSVLSLMAITVMDKIFLDYEEGREILGIYSFYFGISASIVPLSEAFVFSFSYPQLISFSKEGKKKEFSELFRSMKSDIFRYTAMYMVLLLVSVYGILHFLEKVNYLEYWLIFPILLIAHFFYVVSNVYHYGCYSVNQDKGLFYAHIISGGGSLLMMVAFVNFESVYKIPVIVAISYGILMLAKIIFFKNLKKENLVYV